MGNILTKGTLFPEQLTNEMINLVRGKSSLARLAAAEPIPFNGKTEFTFTLDKEVDIVAENGTKTNGGATVAPVTIIPIKFEYGTRVSDEFMFASEEIKLGYLKAFADGFAKKIARGLDIAAMHGFNPRTGTASTVVGNNHFDAKVTQTVTYSTTAPDPDGNVDEAIASIVANDEEASGMAMAPTFRQALADLKNSTNERLYPDLAWGGTPGTLNGLQIDVNNTVSIQSNGDLAIIGNFRDYFKWGYAKEIPIEVIPYGNPDNSTTDGDLKGHNQVYIRGEVYIGWGILVPDAFVIISQAGE